MNNLGYYKKGLVLFKGNPIIIVLAILLAVLHLLYSQGILNGLVLNPNSFANVTSTSLYMVLIGMVIIILVDFFISAAVIGMTSKVLLNEKLTLKTAWQIGKKYTPKLITLYTLIIIIMLILGITLGIIIAIIIGLLKLNIAPNIMGKCVLSLFIGVCALVSFFSIFTYQSIVIGQNSVVNSIKESINLVWNNKIKSLLIAFSLLLTYLVHFIPVIGTILGSTITPILNVYLLMVITLIYLDLTQ